MNINFDNTDIANMFGVENIKNRFEYLYKMIITFVENFDSKDITINTTILEQIIIDYFSSIKEIKSFHMVNNISHAKSCAYLSYWLLKRKPIQLKDSQNDPNLSFINEKFVVSYIICFLTGEQKIDTTNEIFCNFMDQLLYFIKYKDTSVNTLELMITAFQAGLASKVQ